MANKSGIKTPRPRPLKAALFVVITSLGAGSPLAADYIPGLLTPSFIDEIRFGVQNHGVHIIGRTQEDGVDINAEILFRRPDVHFDSRVLSFLFNPRPHIGGHLNTAGGTSQAYVGATWDYHLTNKVFVEFSFGGTLHNGDLNPAPVAGEARSLGCRVMFRESVSVGREITENLRIMVTFDHISNAYLCRENPGLDTIGARLGYRF